MNKKVKATLFVKLVYLVAGSAGYFSTLLIPDIELIWRSAVADIVATFVVFIFSHFSKNASLYDPYWSVMPMWLATWWLIELGATDLILYDWLMIFMVFLWGLRLTWNWWSGWRGMDDQDWRYTDLKKKTGALYPFVNLTGIHLFPTVLVFLGCIPIYYIIKNQAIHHEWSHLQNILYIAFIFVAILLEAVADYQRRHKINHRGGKVYQSGAWSSSRHPNYLGEICFWGGIYMYAMGQHFELYWTGIGTLAMILLFVFVSIPMMERRQLKNKPEYADYQKRVSMLFPWPPKRK